ncbi:MAG: DUF1015 domain-containing protein [bacterium]|nr:DUF1015 domain-containing protein [bacterium]
MARIEPFRAWRPRTQFAEAVASPPYDVLSSDEAREMAAQNPLSFLRVNKPEIDLPVGTDTYSDAVYAKGVENLRRLIDDDVLMREEAPALYLYRQQMGGHIQTGLVCGTSIDEYENDLIKKHEFTRPVKEDDRTRHVDELNANTGPVFLTYRAQAEIDALVERLTQAEPTYAFTANDGIKHTLWVVAAPADRDALVAGFESVQELYVADGHHRSAAAVRIRKMRQDANPNHTGDEAYNFFLSVIFPDNQMMILDYNRVVRDLNGMEPDVFLAKVGESFDVNPIEDGKPTQRQNFGMHLGGQWYALTPKDGSFPKDDPVRSLDVAILQYNLLQSILGIGDPRKDERIDFVGGIRGLGELEKRVESGDWVVAFALFPTSITQLFDVADAGTVMPPKSTWFEPKLRSGLIVRPLDD